MNLKKIESIKKLWKFDKNILNNNNSKIASILIPLIEINNNIFIVLEKELRIFLKKTKFVFLEVVLIKI